MADKICFHRTYKLGVGVDFRPCSEDNFLTGRPKSLHIGKDLLFLELGEENGNLGGLAYACA